ncbi:MAG: OmpA family protein [Paramuribaculum sp.]|nr:OmpA family protein [Paramuribaculum sp.]
MAIAQELRVPYPDYHEEVFMDMDFEQNLFTPEVPAELQNTISDYMVKTANSIKIPNTSVDIMRESDVIAVTIPSDELFLPNDTLLDRNADKYLSKLIPLMKDPYMYKVLVSVHSDDTGSNEYLSTLTDLRQNSIYEWLLNQIDNGKLSEDLVIIPFAMGNSEYLMDNDTRENRRENRRVEFYFIPGPKLMEMARFNKLK